MASPGYASNLGPKGECEENTKYYFPLFDLLIRRIMIEDIKYNNSFPDDCIAVFLYLCISVSLYLCISVSLYLCISVSLYLCIAVSLYLCISVSLYLCISVSLYLCISVSLYLWRALLTNWNWERGPCALYFTRDRVKGVTSRGAKQYNFLYKALK